MKINWKLRFQSYPFWVALFSLIGLVVVDAGLLGVGEWEKYVDAVLLVLIAGGFVADPTTDGYSDSPQALRYNKPKKGGY